MTIEYIDRALAQVQRADSRCAVGRVTALTGATVEVSGLDRTARIGDPVDLIAQNGDPIGAEVIRVEPGLVQLLPDSSVSRLRLGDICRLRSGHWFAPDQSWIGRVIDPDGRPLDGRMLPQGLLEHPLVAPPPDAGRRRGFGPRLATGLAVFDTILPLVQGQRIGLFAGSGVGKSSLLGELGRHVEADVIVIGLVGERGREVREFVEKILGPEGLARSVVIAATSDRPAHMRVRCAQAAVATAEYFRDGGAQVLLLLDSVTRFAEAHRELAVSAGEDANLRGFPASTGPAIAGLCERAGPGESGAGDITAVFSVLVAGSDMEEPVADMLRGVLDGHVVLNREIAERGRFPAIDVLRSVSRSLPDAATPPENQLIQDVRHQLGVYDRSELMIQAGLYTAGSDPAIDRAIALFPKIDRFVALREPKGVAQSFAALRTVLGP